MKLLIFRITQYIVGILFIFSGLIKLNDPVGTQIKLEEYFHVFATDFHPIFSYLVPMALAFSILLCILEVVLGFALIFGSYLKTTINILIVIIVFFTILTAYSAITNKVTDCGCFGDAIKLTPWQSFFKDIFLCVCIVILYLFQPKYSHTDALQSVGIITITGICILLAYIAVEYLPFIDFRPYAVGKDIKSQMKPSAPYKYVYQMISPQGEKVVLKKYSALKGYKLDTMIHLNPEAKPLITDFALWNNRRDLTSDILRGKQALITLQKIDNISIATWLSVEKELKNLIQHTRTHNGFSWKIVTSSDPAVVRRGLGDPILQRLPLVYADATVLKAMIRSKIGLMVLKDGKVLGKWSANHLPSSAQLVVLY